MKKAAILYIQIFSILLIQIGCTEPFDIKTIDFENILVVESTLTNELKQQIIKLSRTTTLENLNVVIENNASVTVKASNGNVFNFSQDLTTGEYLSDIEFQALKDVTYTLHITTKEGKNYISSAVTLPPTIEIDSLYSELISKDDQEGVQVFVNTSDPTKKTKYFKYEYEETYKVVAPFPSSYLAEIVNFEIINGDEKYDVHTTSRTPEEVCYSTVKSEGILQIATSNLNENEVFRFPIRFMNKNSGMLRDRYSILVKQYVQSPEAYIFYKTIKELGNTESLLSQNQPGYIVGNINMVTNSDEKVLGFFEVSSVTSKRIYFNYTDFGVEKPPYLIEDCESPLRLDYRKTGTKRNEDGSLEPNDRANIRISIRRYNYQIIYFHHPFYHIIKQECSVCTSISSNVKPDFWED
ncbi:uncharacterized protein DUF4249 [Aquimarina sp. MAR_2010_214]|uniref:DUF4249 domain-containing protein n=1 Tax=Aquimarina sp. MAR_2010_214 TaxID=1250026 RepID=UPI000C70F041|nr:DUF4249 domain-containing protein [Aquimarina sp. MAR_2010_214]PKV49619.1 uncharacterized protein DUF4249 [Aquimarina sp. MAR_2010_214]